MRIDNSFHAFNIPRRLSFFIQFQFSSNWNPRRKRRKESHKLDICFFFTAVENVKSDKSTRPIAGLPGFERLNA